MFFYEDGASYVYSCALDNFLIDYDVKAFAEESLGINYKFMEGFK